MFIMTYLKSLEMMQKNIINKSVAVTGDFK